MTKLDLRKSRDRAVCKPKWAVTKCDGPLVLYGELLLKKLRAHYVPARYEVIDDETLVFLPDRLRGDFSADFTEFLSLCIRVVNADRRVSGYLSGSNLVLLDGPHFVNPRGQLKKVKQK